MKFIIAYSSRTGNTKFLAEHLKTMIPEEDVVFYGKTKDVPRKSVEEADIIFTGFWTEKGTCDSVTARFLKEIRKKTIALFGTAGFGGSRQYFEKITSSVSEIPHKSCKLTRPFLCTGKITPEVLDRYKAELEKNPGNERILKLIDNFEAAKNHPDSRDLTELDAWIESVIADINA